MCFYFKKNNNFIVFFHYHLSPLCPPPPPPPPPPSCNHHTVVHAVSPFSFLLHPSPNPPPLQFQGWSSRHLPMSLCWLVPFRCQFKVLSHSPASLGGCPCFHKSLATTQVLYSVWSSQGQVLAWWEGLSEEWICLSPERVIQFVFSCHIVSRRKSEWSVPTSLAPVQSQRLPWQGYLARSYELCVFCHCYLMVTFYDGKWFWISLDCHVQRFL